MLVVQVQYMASLYFFQNSNLALCYGHFCVTSNGNKLEIVVNQMNLNINLDLSRAY